MYILKDLSLCMLFIRWKTYTGVSQTYFYTLRGDRARKRNNKAFAWEARIPIDLFFQHIGFITWIQILDFDHNFDNTEYFLITCTTDLPFIVQNAVTPWENITGNYLPSNKVLLLLCFFFDRLLSIFNSKNTKNIERARKVDTQCESKSPTAFLNNF